MAEYIDRGAAILISIKPKWCELIINGKKTLEIRKTLPKLETPFKCYIYCTKDGNDYNPNKNLWKPDKTGFNWLLNGKVIGEFVCNAYLYLGNLSTDKWENLCGSMHDLHKRVVVKEACMTEEDLHKYANKKFCFGWNISELEIYDKPITIDTFDHWVDTGMWSCHTPLKKAPQSWCYVIYTSRN